MTTVIDASVACKWFFEEEDSDAARQLVARNEHLIAPALIFAEVGNIGWRKWRQGAGTSEQLHELGPILASALSDVVASARLCPRAIQIAMALDHPVYDCVYLALSEERDAAFVTADKRLLRKLAGTQWSAQAIGLR